MKMCIFVPLINTTKIIPPQNVLRELEQKKPQLDDLVSAWCLKNIEFRLDWTHQGVKKSKTHQLLPKFKALCVFHSLTHIKHLCMLFLLQKGRARILSHFSKITKFTKTTFRAHAGSRKMDVPPTPTHHTPHNKHPDLKFVKKITRPNFRAKEFYTLKMRKSRLLSPAINSKNASLSVIWPSFG